MNHGKGAVSSGDGPSFLRRPVRILELDRPVEDQLLIACIKAVVDEVA
jgi:hypothetical protein